MRIHPNDNVEVNSDGQKVALCDLSVGDVVIKYGFPIGTMTENVAKGQKLDHTMMRSNLSGEGEWHFTPYEESVEKKQGEFWGYLRENGDVGIRNELWIVPTVGCANGVAKKLASLCGAKVMAHPYGCSQLGGDHEVTRAVLRGLVFHPNAGGVLVLGLGCENNGLETFRPYLGKVNEKRVRFLSLQDCEDEMEEGRAILNQLQEEMKKDVRVKVPLSRLRIAVKCGGSDGYSGITANPLVGAVSDLFYEYGATILMSEIPEVFGAEEILLSRSADRKAFDGASRMIRSFRRYFLDHGEGIADNPSPGNLAGGISTLEEKSLGCVQKAGRVPLCGALSYGETPSEEGGLYLVDGPGNDMVAVTNLSSSGAHLILFTTGRGTPLCGPVPTLKIATNSPLAAKKKHWIDFDAGTLLNGACREELAKELFDLCIRVAEGEETLGEKQGFEDIAIFKNGITL